MAGAHRLERTGPRVGYGDTATLVQLVGALAALEPGMFGRKKQGKKKKGGGGGLLARLGLARDRMEPPPTDPFEQHFERQRKLRELLFREDRPVPEWFWDELDVSLFEEVRDEVPRSARGATPGRHAVRR